MMLKLWQLLAGKSPNPAVRKGPNCDRCGKPTMKPFLYNMPRTPWRCEPCEAEVTDVVLRMACGRVDAGLEEAFRRLGTPDASGRNQDS
ncbi:hypothetical protein [Streptomyces sp. MZ04]|uniref:hypothetical protein n=1 Tax=Streptomyces sp. MZ04 TaxID=2559236 RepID=UPI00107EC25C|nr:hypothetical protein [Streptomyces sp. MZ04]TGB13878.1 hypothetical protein E2651_08030 [Streptomyces sp. MZ04]